MSQFEYDVAVIGGAGRVGCPLAILFAACGMKTVIYDLSEEKVERLRRAEMPFAEEGAAPLLSEAVRSGRLEAETTPDKLSRARFLVFIIGTPVDEHLNPTFTAIFRALDDCRPHLRNGQVLILRSTIFPGISRLVQQRLTDSGVDVRVAFCPERVAQGKSLREFRELPQIISAFDAATLAAVRDLFGRFGCETVEMEPMEAELTKLMTNAWRYIQFATVNQFYMIATQHGLDFDRILHGCRYKYPRMAGMPGPGLAAGPCLVKDTMQLAAFSQNNFVLGHSAMLINEGLPAHLIWLAKQQTNLREKTVGILGMAFKAESDDARDSLSYKLRKLLLLEAREVLCSDPYVRSPDFLATDELLARADVVFVGTPHVPYRSLALRPNVVAIDPWNCLPAGQGDARDTNGTGSANGSARQGATG